MRIQKKIYLMILPFLITYFAPLQAQNMASLQGAQIKIGNDNGAENEKPAFQTILKPFLIDKNLVTVGQFRLFIKINRYITDAEKMGKGYILDSLSSELQAIEGAYWAYPLGPNQPKAQSHEPVRQVSWQDAEAYANWIGKRLPSEYELEYAAQNAAKLEIQQLDGSVWQWSDTWYQAYDASDYFQNTLNRKKTIKGGSLTQHEPFRTSIRQEVLPSQVRYDIGFRCAQDAE